MLVPEVFERAAEEFPDMRDEFWKGYLHVNETKYSNTQPDTWGADADRRGPGVLLAAVRGVPRELTGIEDLMPDWSMDGGGLHQTLRGGHLNIHADFTTHHAHENWARRVNILLYLNREWHDEWGGKLELWDKDMTACQDRVTPAGNRMLVFTTSCDSFHGHPDGLTCPPDVARRSMALYYFTEEEHAVRRSTNYRARPEDGLAQAGDRRRPDARSTSTTGPSAGWASPTSRSQSLTRIHRLHTPQGARARRSATPRRDARQVPGAERSACRLRARAAGAARPRRGRDGRRTRRRPMPRSRACQLVRRAATLQRPLDQPLGEDRDDARVSA